MGGFDDRLGDVGGADEFAAPDLTLGDEVVASGRRRNRAADCPTGERAALSMPSLRPAIVVHRLGDPLVAEVLDDGVDQAVPDRWGRCCGGCARVRVAVCGDESMVTSPWLPSALGHDHGDQPYRWLGKVVPLRVAQHPSKRDVAVAQHSPHLEVGQPWPASTIGWSLIRRP